MFLCSYAVDDDVIKIGSGKRQFLQYFVHELLKVC